MFSVDDVSSYSRELWMASGKNFALAYFSPEISRINYIFKIYETTLHLKFPMDQKKCCNNNLYTTVLGCILSKYASTASSLEI